MVQRAFRADGARVRDGGGVSSPLLVDPAAVRADGWPDVLERVRTVLHWAAIRGNVTECIRSCSVVCSKLMRGVESKLDVSGLERQHANLQIALKADDSSRDSCKRMNFFRKDQILCLDYRY